MRNPQSTSKFRRAFTLVELLVVIGIIALLISILIPALAKARQHANSISCLSNLHNMGLAMAMYQNQNKGQFPLSTGAYDSQGNLIHWGSLLSQTMGIGTGTIVSATDSSVDSRRLVFICKDAPSFNTTLPLNEYSAHPLLMPNVSLTYPAVVAWGQLQNQPRTPYRINRLNNTADLVIIWDGVLAMNDNSTAPDGYALDNQRITNTNSAPAYYLLRDFAIAQHVDLGQSIDAGPNVDDTTDTNNTDKIYGNIRWRHMGNRAANFLFADGHGGSFRYNPPPAGSQGGTSDLKRRNIAVPNP